MKLRILSALAASAICVGLGASTAGAQSRDSTRAYDVQAGALRYEASWGNARIIRGADGPVVGTSGWFRDFDVEKLVASSPGARAEARVYKSNSYRASIVAPIGALATLVGVVVTANGASNASSPMLIIAGVGAMAWSAQHFHIAASALSRSLWWYNRDVARSTLAAPPTAVAVPHRETEQSKRD